jgi:hypothetical protein
VDQDVYGDDFTDETFRVLKGEGNQEKLGHLQSRVVVGAGKVG